MSEIYRANPGEKAGQYEVYRHIPDAADQRYVVKKVSKKDEEGKASETWHVSNKKSGEEISSRSGIHKKAVEAVEKRYG